MFAQLIDELKALWQELRPHARRAWITTLLALRGIWDHLRPPLVFALEVLAALILLFEEWGWQPMVEALSRLAAWRPWARLELFIAGLPPYGALAALALPSSILFPLKFAALYLVAQGHVLSAGAVFVFAKVASTALVARIFMLTKPELMQIGWFRAAYELVVPWKDHMFALIRESWAWRYGRMVKNRVRRETKQAWQRWRPVLVPAWQRWRARIAAGVHALKARVLTLVSNRRS